MKTALASAAFVLLALASCTKNAETPALLTVDFTLPREAENQVMLSFENLSQNATRYKWTFGDGTAAATQASPQHTFATRGTYPVTLTAYRNSDSVAITKNLSVRLYDAFAQAGIPVTSTYLTHSRREEHFIDNNGNSSYRTSSLPDLPLTIVRISPDTIRVNGNLGVPQAGDTQFRVGGFSGGDANILKINITGDSVTLSEYSHSGHFYFQTDIHTGPRQR